MDFHSLVATNLPPKRQPMKMDAEAEERYYRDHDTSLRLWLGPLVYFATAAGLVVLLTSIAQT
jgi:hypothetical protein